MQFAYDLIEFYLKINKLTEEHLQQIWNFTNFDKSWAYCIFYNFNDDFNKEHKDFIAEKICNEIPLSKLERDDLELFRDFQTRNEEEYYRYKKKLLKYFEKLI